MKGLNYAVGIARVSTKKQTDGASLEMQGNNISIFCHENNMVLLQVFQIVGSGKSLSGNRTFADAIKLAKSYSKQGCSIVVNSVDRFSRNIEEGTEFLHDLLSNKINFISVTENLFLHKSSDSTDLGLFESLLNTAHHEAVRIGQRAKDSYQYRKQYGHQFGRVPFPQTAYYIYVDRTREGLPPLEVRKFQITSNDQVIINYITQHLDDTNEKLLDNLIKLKFNDQPLSLPIIVKIKKYLSKLNKPPSEPKPKIVPRTRSSTTRSTKKSEDEVKEKVTKTTKKSEEQKQPRDRKSENEHMASLGWRFGIVPFPLKVKWVPIQYMDGGELVSKDIRTFELDPEDKKIIDFIRSQMDQPSYAIFPIVNGRIFRDEPISIEAIDKIKKYIVKSEKS